MTFLKYQGFIFHFLSLQQLRKFATFMDLTTIESHGFPPEHQRT